MIEQHFEYGRSDPSRAHEMYHEDAVLEFPQSGERFEGVENFREWRSEYPASTAVEFHEVRGEGAFWVVELAISYDGGPAKLGVSLLEIRDGRIARESIYVTEAWEAPEWRSKWRATP
jgi:ketosteroid isomerase-like protein